MHNLLRVKAFGERFVDEVKLACLDVNEIINFAEGIDLAKLIQITRAENDENEDQEYL